MQSRTTHLFCQFFIEAEHTNYSHEGVSNVRLRDTDSQHRPVSMDPFIRLALRPWLSVNKATSSRLPGTPFPPSEHLLHIHFQTVCLVNILQGRCRYRGRQKKQQAISFPCSHFSSVKKDLCQKPRWTAGILPRLRLLGVLIPLSCFHSSSNWLQQPQGFVLFWGSFTPEKHSVYFRKEVPSSGHR